jgi:orotidine-5'-phosphate decarboxylase
MERFKQDFLDFLSQSGGRLRIGGDYKLKSGRSSPHFVNIGDVNDGLSTLSLGSAYGQAIIHSGAVEDPGQTLLYGIPEKGVGLAIATSIGMGMAGVNLPWFFTRKAVKGYGEATNLTQAERIKAFVVGRAPQDGQSIIQLDDVFTAGDAKYEARKSLQELGTFKLPLLAIAVDRQEVGVDGTSAIEKYEAETGTRVVSIVNATDILEYLRNKPDTDPRAIERMENYLRVYGTAAARSALPTLEQRIIGRDRSIIPACDVRSLEDFGEIVRQTADVDGIGGYKVGFELGLTHGLPRVVEAARKHTSKPVIYDHQKAGTDIPDTGKNFAGVCKDAGVDAVIFFPQAGPETERAWIYHALDKGLKVIVGGRMTHPAYAVSEGGFITDEGALEMYRIAARAGVNNFVVPGNKPAVIKQVRELVESEGAKPTFYAPGFVAQGGSISDAAKVAGDNWHAIVGRGITEAPNKDYRAAALEHTQKL